MFETHLWKSDTLPLVFFKDFVSENQLPGLSVKGTLVENGFKENHYFSFPVLTKTTFVWDSFSMYKTMKLCPILGPQSWN